MDFHFLLPASIWVPTSQSLAGFIGAAIGSAFTGILGLSGVWIMSKRLHRMRVLDHARRDLKGPVAEYIDWLHALGGEFPLWRQDLLPVFRADSPRDQFELNRMRKLFVDPRSSTWFARLEEYEGLLGKFSQVIQAIWHRQAEIGERFHRVLSRIGDQPAMALNAAEQIEALAFEQAQLASDFMDHLQYECLKSVIGRGPRSGIGPRKVKIVRTALGNIRLEEPALHL